MSGGKDSFAHRAKAGIVRNLPSDLGTMVAVVVGLTTACLGRTARDFAVAAHMGFAGN